MSNLGKFSKQLITDKKEVSSWKEKIRVINEDIEELTDNVPYVEVFFFLRSCSLTYRPGGQIQPVP